MSKLFHRNNRKTIAITTGIMSTHYDYTLSRAVRSAALEKNINLLILICGSMKRNLNHKYEYQNNIMYYMPTCDSIDGLILLPSIVYNYSEKSCFEDLLRHYSGIPLITLSEPVEGFPGIIVDNSSGIRDLVNHLYTEHGKRRFAFVCGPENNGEAKARLEGFLQGISDVNLEINESMIFPGDFWITGGKEAVHRMEASGVPWPEAIICSNDYSAYGVYEELKKRNISIPNDIVVTGFDNMQGARYSIPPLTSIEQPLEEMGSLAVDLLSKMMNGAKVPSTTTLRSKVIYRWSTGCSRWSEKCTGKGKEIEKEIQPTIHFRDPDLISKTLKWLELLKTADLKNVSERDSIIACFTDLQYQTVYKKENLDLWDDFLFDIHAILETRADGNGMIVSILQGRLAEIRELYLGLKASQSNAYSIEQAKVVQRILSVFTTKELLLEINSQIPKLGIASIILCLYPKPFNHYLHDKWEIPKESHFLSGYCHGIELPPPENRVFNTRDILPPDLELPDEPLALVMMAACFRETHYGYLLMEASINDDQVYTNLGAQISTAYRGILVFNEKEQKTVELSTVLAQLRESNHKLEELSTHDALTGLYNRRGFMQFGQKYHDLAVRNDTDYVLFYIDMDGLKSINDTWGHAEGDKAIASFGEVLQNAFRGTDIVARLGGDEFTICTSNTRPECASLLQKRLESYVENFNADSSSSWKLSYSIGCVIHSQNSDLDFSGIMSLADSKLYKNKRQKKGETVA